MSEAIPIIAGLQAIALVYTSFVIGRLQHRLWAIEGLLNVYRGTFKLAYGDLAELRDLLKRSAVFAGPGCSPYPNPPPVKEPRAEDPALPQADWAWIEPLERGPQ